ncbi:MAG: nitrite reductase [Cohaesibacter sp.]|nr:nitrite reductase [Cohaesibacter sp.]
MANFSSRSAFVGTALLLASVASPSLANDMDAAQLYADNCADCHQAERLGGTGPALIPQTLKRKKQAHLAKIIAKGLEQTQMPAFGEDLTEKQIVALADYIKQPLGSIPKWDKADMMATRVFNEAYTPADKPVFSGDPMNIFIVVETGDHHASVLDGDSFTRLDRFETPYALHGGPKYTPDGHYVFFMSRDGWVMKYDVWSLQVVAKIRVGINSRNIAMSADGQHLAVASYLPHNLVVLSTKDLSVEKIFDARAENGNSSRVSAVYQDPFHGRFIVAFKDIAEVWDIASQKAKDGSRELFDLRRISVPEPLDDFFFDQSYTQLMGSARDGKTGMAIDMADGSVLGRIKLPGFPHLGSGISWKWGNKRVMATPHLREAKVSVVDMDSWSIVKTIETEGPGFFMRSHENSPYAWSGVFFGPNKDKMHIIDKKTLEIVKTLQPIPGKTAAHIEFDRDGKHAIMSIWEKDGMIIIYDAKTFKEVKRMKMSKPSGKYNVWNKITFSEGTSH